MSRSFLAAVLLAMITMLATNTALANTPDCPYPCLPPPTSGGIINSYPPPPPAATGGSGGDGFGGSYPPSPPGSYQLTPPGVTPGYLAPPYSTVPIGPAPPPPNPILPWFPWYYQHNNPITGSMTSASSPPAVHRRSTCMVALLLPLWLVILLRSL